MTAIFRPSANLAATLALAFVAALLVFGVGWWWAWPGVDGLNVQYVVSPGTAGVRWRSPHHAISRRRVA